MNTVYDWAVFAVVSAAVLIGANVALPRSWPPGFRRVVLFAVAARIPASLARLLVISAWYGRGDAYRYFGDGLVARELLFRGDFDAFFAGVPWGTAFIVRLSGAVLTVVGPSIHTEFLVFSLFGLTGLVLIALVFARAYSGSSEVRRFTVVLLFWPSVMFWPSSVGKEAVIMLASGLCVYGWYGRSGAIRWPVLIAGIALAMLIRPHIAMMIGVALGTAEWIAVDRPWTISRIARAIVLAAVAVYTATAALQQLGVEASLESVQDFVDVRSGKSEQGGSRITVVTGPAAVPLAFVNVLLRPFPWEVRNPLIALAALEIAFFWRTVWVRRHALVPALRRWRKHRLLLFVVPVTLVLTFFYGSFIGNLGILARQRVIILPMLFLLIHVTARRPTGMPR